MTSLDSSIMTLQEIDEIIVETEKKFELQKSNVVESFSKPVESLEDSFFKQIRTKISDELRNVKLYGKEKITKAINSVKDLLENAKTKLQEKFENLLKQIEQFISTLFNEFMKKSLDLIPKKIEQGNQGYFKLDSVTFSRSIALESGVTASLTKFFEMVVSGELSFNAEYAWNSVV